jgi:radical SAM protein with 4Fe4S-binding SPASM domain
MNMSVSDFDQIVKKLFPTLIEAHPTNIGEPLISPWFGYFCQKCKEYGVLLDITSNGTLLTQEKIAEIMPCLLDIKISFDGFKKETFETIRKGANYELIVDNIKNLVRIRNVFSSSATITLQTTLFNFNYKELSDIINFAKEIGVDKVKAYPVFSYSEAIDKVSIMNCLDEFSEYRKKCVELARNIGIKLYLTEPPAKDSDVAVQRLVHQKCRLPWAECFIDYDGRVYPCHTHNHRAFENIISSSEYDVWNSKYAQILRNALVSDNLNNTICDNCGNNYVRTKDSLNVPYNKDDYLFNKTGDQNIHWGKRCKQFLLNR